MRPPTCATCGAPLPTVPADPAHPERCPACAARAVGAPGPTSNIPPPPPGGWTANAPTTRDLVVKTRLLDSVLTGIGFATLGGLVYWAVVALTGQDLPYVGVVVGVLVGQGVLVGARRGGPIQGAMAGVFTLLSLVVTQYFVARSLLLHDQPSFYMPLWDGTATAKDMVQDSVKDSTLVPLTWLVAVAVAAFSTALPSRRSVLG